MYTYTLRSNDSTAKQALQWTRQGHRGTGRPWNAWKAILNNKCGQQTSATTTERRQQHKTELDGVEP